MARGPRLPRTPENDIRLIANYCQRLDTILARLTPEEIQAMTPEDRDFLIYFAGRTSISLHNARGWAFPPDHSEYAGRAMDTITKRPIL